jgi:hypothetical protein
MGTGKLREHLALLCQSVPHHLHWLEGPGLKHKMGALGCSIQYALLTFKPCCRLSSDFDSIL